MKRLSISLIAALTGAALLLGSCAPPPEELPKDSGASSSSSAPSSTPSEAAPSTSDAPAPASNVTLRFVKAGTEPEQRAYYEKALPEFEAQTGIKVVYEDAGWDDIDTKLNMMFASGQSPDVMRYAISSVAQRASMGQYEDITDRYNAWSGKDDLMESAVNAGVYLGRNYGLGVFVGHAFTIYRTDYLQEAGLDPEKLPQNQDELLEWARKLTVKEGGKVVRSGISVPTSGNAHHHVLPLVMQRGGRVVDYESDKPTFTDPEYADAMGYLVNFQNEGLLIPYTMMKDKAPFFYGNSAILYQADSAELKNILDAHPELEGKLKIALQPFYGDIKASFGGSQLLFMSSESQHKDEAWQLMEFLLTPEQIWQQFEIAATPPVLHSLKDRFIEVNPEQNQVIFDAMEIMVGNPTVTWAPLYIKYLQQAYEQAMYGEKTVEQALADAQSALLEELAAS